MNKLKLMFIWCLMIGIMTSCGNDEDATPASAEQDYVPTTKGSTWSYGGASPYTLTATGNTKVIDGKTYAEMETKQGSETRKSYVLKEKGVYTAIGMDPTMGNFALMFLKEETPVGKPWFQTSTINGMDATMTFTILEKGATKTVQGNTFKDVIHVEMVSTYTQAEMGIEFNLTSEYYWAKGVGLILSDLEQVGEIPLMTYSIK
ncbi:hypothetical protein ACSX1A_05675 [Pontibacter sp. MBLB2868]|uniref:hypothetical protein n=1 Tax=Pontibacter sp. MBLB2868 TaxID=3451555 RepID=UPI003F74D034